MSGGSSKDTLTTRKSSSSLPTTAATNSSRKASSGASNSKNNDSEGNSFWSSFLGDSFSSTTTNTESKTSGRRPAGRKPGSRVSGVETRVKGRSSDERRKAVESANTSGDNDGSSSSRALKQQKKNDVDVTNTSESISNLSASNPPSSQEEETGNVTGNLPKNDNKTVFDISKGEDVGSPENAECNAHDVSVEPIKSSNKLESEPLKPSSIENNEKDNNKDLNSPGNDSSSLLVIISTPSSSKDLKEDNINHTQQEPAVLLEEEQNQSHNTETADSSAVKLPEESCETNEDVLGSVKKTDGVVNSQDAKGVSASAVSKGMDGSLFMDSTDNIAVTDKSGHEFPQESESVDQPTFLKVEPLASSTPNRLNSNESSDKGAKSEQTISHDASKCREVLTQGEGLSVDDSNALFTEIRDNVPVSGNETEVFVDAVSAVQSAQSVDSVSKWQPEEVPSNEAENDVDRSPLQQLSMRKGEF